MSVLVTDAGFAPEDWTFGFHAPGQSPTHDSTALALDIVPDFDVTALPRDFAAIDLIRLHVPQTGDGRAFSQARLLRLLGFTGRLRAQGEVLPDQYPLARRCGFDEVEISRARAARQPEGQWRAQLACQTGSYQDRLRHFA